MHLPSIKISSKNRIAIQRMLPGPGEVLVQAGQPVNALTVIAEGEIPGGIKIINIAHQLGLADARTLDMEEIIQVELGEYVSRYDVLVSYKGPGSLLGKTVRAPEEGYVSAIHPGWIALETERKVTEIQAFINGVVTRLVPHKGAVVEANGALIEAACGFGGEAYGRLRRMVNSPYDVLTPDLLNESASESIIIGGRTLDAEALYAAEEWQVRGIIVGSIPAGLLNVDPPVQVRVVATEGFGGVPMSPHTFGILISLSRREVSIRGQMPLPPSQKPQTPVAKEKSMIIATDPLTSRGGYVSLPEAPKKQDKTEVVVGSKVRVIQGAFLGNSGTIDLLPPEPQTTESGIIAPGAFVKFSTDVHFIPWANMQIIA